MWWILVIAAIFAVTVCLAACNVSSDCSRDEEERELARHMGEKQRNKEEETE